MAAALAEMFEEDQRKEPPSRRGLKKTMSFGDFNTLFTRPSIAAVQGDR